MRNFIHRIFFSSTHSVPIPVFWKGVAYGTFLLIIALAGITGFHLRTGISPVFMSLTWMIFSAVVFLLSGKLISLLRKNVDPALPQIVVQAIIAAGVTYLIIDYTRGHLNKPFFEFTGTQLLNLTGVIYFLANASLIGLLFFLFKHSLKYRKARIAGILSFIIIFADIYGIAFLVSEGASQRIDNATAKEFSPLSVEPYSPGTFHYDYFTYGSGQDRVRNEFREVRFTTPSVNASILLPEWKGSKATWREKYWGFGVREFPLNGRVWFPRGEGPFPLVLIVHGNHSMEHHSDPGYAYLGEFLASKGFITISLDENFINGTWSGDFRGKEMPARAWLMLKHLELWRTWNQDHTHELFHKIDLENIILVGHSRGGEAVTIAAAYNKLEHFPDNAHETFNFNFNIKGLVAIAPTDKRYERRIKLENINYLSIQGSYDSDEASFFGLRQYHRITFNDSLDWFKAGIYIHGANHGQFNSIWGRKDSSGPRSWLLNLSPIIKGEEQRELAKGLISAFAEIICKGKKEYLDLFKSHQKLNGHFPHIPILSNFSSSQYLKQVTYEEDINVSTWEKGNITGTNLKTWREEKIKFRDKDLQGVNGAVLGWDYGTSIKTDSLANYTVQWDESKSLMTATHLVLNLASYWEDEESEHPSLPIDFTVLLTDSSGKVIKGSLSEFGTILNPLEIKFTKLLKLNKEMYGDKWEPALQDIRLDLSRLPGETSFEWNQLKSLELRFDLTNKGMLLINEIGFDLQKETI